MKVQICALAFLALVATVYSCPEVDGEYAVTRPNKEDCTTFFLCAHGEPVLFSCPAGLHFNRKLGVCDWPASAGCREYKPKPTWKPTTTTRRPRPTTRRPHKPRDVETESETIE